MRVRKVQAAAIALLALPFCLPAQETHIVKNFNDYYHPEVLTIRQGDTVLWDNPHDGPLTHQHDLNSVGDKFPGRGFGHIWQHEVTFDEPGTYDYYCSRHGAPTGGEMGTIIVQQVPGGGGGGGGGSTFDIDAGLNGNWWSGPDRNGEGVQVEIADDGGGGMVLVATVYSYGPDGGQVFMIAVGTPSGNTAEVDVFITDGGLWGSDFDPGTVTETQWGTGMFTAESCDAMQLSLTPDPEFQTLGYTAMEYDLVRLTTPMRSCPADGSN